MPKSAELPTSTDLFKIRRAALAEEVIEPLRKLYGERDDVDEVIDLMFEVAAEAWGERPQALRELDEARLTHPDWFQRPDQLGYVCYADRFAGGLDGVRSRLDHLAELGVTTLHVMPVLEPRQGPNDGGYAVASYRRVDPRLGTMDDLRGLASDLHERGMSLVCDLVCNHTAAEHPWARKARAGKKKYRDYYWMYPDRDMPEAWEKSLPEVFPDWAPGNFTWLPDAEQWVWTTFNEYQWDLNYTNPRVLAEMVANVCFLANVGVDIIRLDAVAFMWKRLGTTCQNQPEAHLIVEVMRAVLRMVAPASILLAEAIVAPEDLVPWFGRGESTGQECQLAYHNVFMVTLWSALAEHDARLMSSVLNRMPQIPSSASWLTYARLHDDIGWAITDQDAAAVGLDGFAHRAFLSDFYSGGFPGSFAVGEVFQSNPRTGDRRISGTLASLAGLERALAPSGSSTLVEHAIRRILLVHSLVFAFGGLPLINSGDEIGMLNDHAWADEPSHADDNRWMHRPVMDWDAAARRHTPGTVEARIFEGLQHLAAVRSTVHEFHADTPGTALDVGNSKVFAWHRSGPRGRILVLANVTDEDFSVDTMHGGAGHDGEWIDLLTGEKQGRIVRLDAYTTRWLRPVPPATKSRSDA